MTQIRFRDHGRRSSAKTRALPLRILGLAIVTTLVVLAFRQSRRDEIQKAASAGVVADPLAADIARCGAITPEQNALDDTCRRVWAESRRRFLMPVPPRPNTATNNSLTAVPGKAQDRLPAAVTQPDHGEAR